MHWLYGSAASPRSPECQVHQLPTPHPLGPPRRMESWVSEKDSGAKSRLCLLASLAPSEGLSEHTLNPAPELSSQRCRELQLRDSGQGQGSRIFAGDSGPLGGGVGGGGETDQGRAGAEDGGEVAERWEQRPALAHRHSARRLSRRDRGCGRKARATSQRARSLAGAQRPGLPAASGAPSQLGARMNERPGPRALGAEGH